MLFSFINTCFWVVTCTAKVLCVVVVVVVVEVVVVAAFGTAPRLGGAAMHVKGNRTIALDNSVGSKTSDRVQRCKRP